MVTVDSLVAYARQVKKPFHNRLRFAKTMCRGYINWHLWLMNLILFRCIRIRYGNIRTLEDALEYTKQTSIQWYSIIPINQW